MLMSIEQWWQVDATEKSMGRLASQIAIVLMGKHKPIYTKGNDCGDYVVVTNCKDMHIFHKPEKKFYYKHTNYPGHLYKTSYKTLVERKGYYDALRRAVRKMLPRNTLRNRRMERFKAYDGEDHPYGANLMRWNDRDDQFGGRVTPLVDAMKRLMESSPKVDFSVSADSLKSGQP